MENNVEGKGNPASTPKSEEVDKNKEVQHAKDGGSKR